MSFIVACQEQENKRKMCEFFLSWISCSPANCYPQEWQSLRKSFWIQSWKGSHFFYIIRAGRRRCCLSGANFCGNSCIVILIGVTGCFGNAVDVVIIAQRLFKMRFYPKLTVNRPKRIYIIWSKHFYVTRKRSDYDHPMERKRMFVYDKL